mmetsp:Transcript_21939/g.28409  ORF Transcript_21939/g.28409 Transcript_21939/m.28409 type:complete len:99 (+) Transcript_21939:191-487(+)|eukprot:CAMPEP_0198143416 /NCGR_PEP_ID=MMETSP1443-20131203/7367_1 /TAXON_ID=186043 /ORGANISM="Entomoneis sp., Strain CCMP2396" /LENGTH=98 /DNA_ID=CAMNT_0043806651 /DNA_START=149 /DNA_END=445 /DNA_ORIENTATION=+
MTEAENQAKQLDSVTDRVEEQEVDITKAHEAMTSLGAASAETQASEADVAVSAEDIKIICDELEVTEEFATKTLREVARDTKDGESIVAATLRKLITS